MCKNTKCFFALADGGIVLYCGFYCKGKNLIPEQCQIPFLRGDQKEEEIIDLVEEVIELSF